MFEESLRRASVFWQGMYILGYIHIAVEYLHLHPCSKRLSISIHCHLPIPKPPRIQAGTLPPPPPSPPKKRASLLSFSPNPFLVSDLLGTLVVLVKSTRDS